MRLRHLISLSCLLLLAGQKAGAQLAPADDFFHSGARYYISNNIPDAKAVVEQGLKIYPDDQKLKKLEELLNQQQQQQQNQQSQSQQSQSQQQQSDEQKKQQQKSQDQQKQDQADQKKDEQQKQAEQDKADQDKKDEAQPAKPGEMTPEEAKRLLDAQKDNEQLLQFTPPEKPRDPSRPVKDW